MEKVWHMESHEILFPENKSVILNQTIVLHLHTYSCILKLFSTLELGKKRANCAIQAKGIKFGAN